MTVIKVCLHCGNKTQMDLIFEHEHVEGEYEYEDGMSYQVAAYYNTFKFFQCLVCSGFILERVDSDTFTTDNNGRLLTCSVTLYPSIDRALNKFPHGVKKAYESAQKVRNIDGAVCAMAIRRTLEKMCKDKGAKGKDLYSKLKNLSEEGVIPPILDDMAKLIKDIGNEAAHADEVEFDEHLINSLLRFTDIILEYVYILPQEIKKLQRSISLRSGIEEEVKEK